MKRVLSTEFENLKVGQLLYSYNHDKSRIFPVKYLGGRHVKLHNSASNLIKAAFEIYNEIPVDYLYVDTGREYETDFLLPTTEEEEAQIIFDVLALSNTK